MRAQPAAGAKTPAFALLDPADAAQWQAWAKDSGWQVIAANFPADATVDTRVRALAAAVQSAVANSGVDPARVYVAGRGASTPAVFYAVSRMPDAWSAAIAIGGSPQAAVETGRIYAVNFGNTPILWAGVTADDESLASKLKAAGLNLEWRYANALTPSAASQWLAGHVRDAFPISIDCETDSPAFPRCYWTEMARFDASERNDVLPPSAIPAGTTAVLDLGGFTYKRDDPGPGVLVSALQPRYDGPLKVGDRIVALDGKPVENVASYEGTMRAVAETRDAVVMLQRGADRMRVETRIVVNRRPPVTTARVQAKYDPEAKEVQIISRTVAEIKVNVPAHWLPASLVWNGLTLEELKTPGCLALRIEKELLRAEKCQ